METKYVMAGVLLVILLMTVPSIVSAGATEHELPPPDADNSTNGVVIFVDASRYDDATAIDFEWSTSYPARSEAEAERARSETLDTEWHRGYDYVRAVRERYPGGRIDVNTTAISFEQSGRYEHGEITVRSTVRWVGPFDENERLEFGPELRDRLSHGDRLRITIPDDWSVANASVGPTRGNTLDSYRWTIGEGPEPHFVVTEDDVPEESEITWMDWVYWGIMAGAMAVVFLFARHLWDRNRVG